MYLPLGGVESYDVIVNRNRLLVNSRERTVGGCVPFCFVFCFAFFFNGGVHLVKMFSNFLVDMQITVDV